MMNIENIVLVRAIDYLPLDGILLPSCESKYLIFNEKDNYYYLLKSIIQKNVEKDLGRSLNLWEETDNKILKSILKDYLPLTSSYTSTLSFSLNGLVPDDMNNTFSEMKFAVLDPMKYHENENYINVDVIDTTIKGSIKTSEECILVIDQNEYSLLSEETKNNLRNHYKIELFSGSLKEAISNILQKYNYPALPLVQKKELHEISECNEKDSMIKFQDEFALAIGASRLKLQQLYTYPLSTLTGIDVMAAEKAQSDFDKNLVIEKYYKDKFYEFLTTIFETLGFNLTDEEKYYLFSDFSYSEDVLKKVVESIIQVCGFEKYKLFIQEYNQNVMNNYITNEEIIMLEENTRK